MAKYYLLEYILSLVGYKAYTIELSYSILKTFNIHKQYISFS